MSGRTYLAIPGPSVVPERVLNAMHRASPNIYEGEIVDMTHTIVADLKRVAMTKHHVAIYIANGHGAWEAAFSNLFSRGDKALVAATGRFGIGWAETAQRMGVDVHTHRAGEGVGDANDRPPLDKSRTHGRVFLQAVPEPIEPFGDFFIR